MSYESAAKAELKKVDDRFKKLESRIANVEKLRETLISYGEILKAEYKYLGSLQRGNSAMYEALKKELPGLEAEYAEQAEQVFGQDYPATAENLQQLDAIVARLKAS